MRKYRQTPNVWPDKFVVEKDRLVLSSVDRESNIVPWNDFDFHYYPIKIIKIWWKL